MADKPLCEMSLEDLLAERARWNREIENATGWGASLAAAAEMRQACDVHIERLQAKPQPAPAQSHDDGWRWWGSTNEENFTYGPCKTRDEVIDEAIADRMGEFQDENGTWMIGVHICEARQDPLRVADWIGTEELLEHAEETLADSDRVAYEYDEGPWFECSTEQAKDFQARINAACDEWQKAHNLVFVPRTFSDTRSLKFIAVPYPAQEDEASNG